MRVNTKALGLGKAKAKPAKGAKKDRLFASLVAYCKSRNYPIPEPEFRFHPVRRWRWDAAWPDRMLAVEIHGAVWVQGRHTTGKGFSEDQVKFATAAVMGWRLAPVTTSQFESGAIFELLDYEFARGVDINQCDNPNGPCACGAWHEEGRQ